MREETIGLPGRAAGSGAPSLLGDLTDLTVRGICVSLGLVRATQLWWKRARGQRI